MQTGFTLIEVILVVIIMAIITTSAFGGMLNLQRTSRVNTIFRQFSNFFELARSYSLNGKLVTDASCEGNKPCVPKSFGVIAQKQNDIKKCPSGYDVNLIYQKTNAQDFLSSNIVVMDSFCVNPKVEFWYAKAAGDYTKFAEKISFSYAPPFGTFSSTNQTATPQPITLSFCEAATDTSHCDPQLSYTKVLTLYTNVGVLE